MSSNETDKVMFRKGWNKVASFIGSATLVIIVILVFGFVGGCTFRVAAVTHVDNYELGYKFDRRSGKIERLGRTGYHVAWPVLVAIHTVDLRPVQVCINANNRVLNCKLVEFNPDGLETFVGWHGRNDYSIDSKGLGSFTDILLSYSYDPHSRSYPFLNILKELKGEELVEAVKQ